jgi:hypothetical protein
MIPIQNDPYSIHPNFQKKAYINTVINVQEVLLVQRRPHDLPQIYNDISSLEALY